MALDVDKISEPLTDGDTKLCRRRPGRIENVPPSLIPLLRDAGRLQDIDIDAVALAGLTIQSDIDATQDGLAAIRGVVWGVALSVPLWAVITLGFYQLLR